MLASLALPLLAQLQTAQEPVRYELRFPNATHHEAEIRATFSGVTAPVLEVVMSRSSPGRYALHEFAKNVYNFRATDGMGHALPVTRPSPYQWNVGEHKGTVVIDYTLYGDRADGTYNGIDATHAHLNIPATLIWAHQFYQAPASIRFEVPAGSNWKVATQLLPGRDGTYLAPNVDWMMDSPVELSAFTMREWKVGDAQFRMALHHMGIEEEASAYARMSEAVVLEEEGIFGSLAKYDNGTYTFLLDYLPYASGDGMEHRDSTIIAGTHDLKDDAASMIGTVSHEFFHSWNVERIRPKGLEPFDFEHANMSGELWFAEGITSYYGPLTLKRSGLWSSNRFLKGLGYAVGAVLNAPGRQIFDVIDMSRQAPFVDAATANDPVNYANTFISYYTYGEALGLGIDLSIRSRFPGKTLDDWMRAMWREHPDVQKPYTLADLQATLAGITSKEFADEIFRRHIYGLEPLDYASLLARAGLLLEKEKPGKVWLGAHPLHFSEKGVEVGITLRNSPLYLAGLDHGDLVVEWDGKILKNEKELDAWLDTHKPGDKVKLKMESRSGKKDVEVELAESPALHIVEFEQAGRPLTAEMASFRAEWLGSKAIRPLPKLEKYCHECKRAFQFEYDKCPYDGTDLKITRFVEPAKTK